VCDLIESDLYYHHGRCVCISPEEAVMELLSGQVRRSMFGLYFLLLNLQDFDPASEIKTALKTLKKDRYMVCCSGVRVVSSFS